MEHKDHTKTIQEVIDYCSEYGVIEYSEDITVLDQYFEYINDKGIKLTNRAPVSLHLELLNNNIFII